MWDGTPGTACFHFPGSEKCRGRGIRIYGHTWIRGMVCWCRDWALICSLVSRLRPFIIAFVGVIFQAHPEIVRGIIASGLLHDLCWKDRYYLPSPVRSWLFHKPVSLTGFFHPQIVLQIPQCHGMSSHNCQKSLVCFDRNNKACRNRCKFLNIDSLSHRLVVGLLIKAIQTL